MEYFPSKAAKNLQNRKKENTFRQLGKAISGTDFSSNDYLGFATSEEIYKNAAAQLQHSNLKNGSGGSRLLTGNYPLYEKLEAYLAHFHKAEAALVFNSGFDANIGLFSSLPKKGDVVFYDELVHASIREGLRLSQAKSYKFRHNDVAHLEEKAVRITQNNPESSVFVLSESVFSMDGDCAPLSGLVACTKKHGFFLILDEAHATGVFGENGQGLVQEKALENAVFARIHTFGKAMGAHGAAILGSQELKDYLTNFASSFIYTTGLPPHTPASILSAYHFLKTKDGALALKKLKANIKHFKAEIGQNKLNPFFIESHSAIQSCIITGNKKVKKVSEELQRQGFSVKAILSPTVPAGKERLRFCLHSFNSKEEIEEILRILKKRIM